MDPSLQLRKLPLRDKNQLVNILDADDCWKLLMSKIPTVLEKNNYKCDVTRYNLPKYHSEHFKILENVSKRDSQSCSALLFGEWSTSGRVLPTLGHLQYLLVKAQLYRAADYVAKIMNQPPPPRPPTGPAAPVYLDEFVPQKVESTNLGDSLPPIDDLLNNSNTVSESISNSGLSYNNSHQSSEDSYQLNSENSFNLPAFSQILRPDQKSEESLQPNAIPKIIISDSSTNNIPIIRTERYDSSSQPSQVDESGFIPDFSAIHTNTSDNKSGSSGSSSRPCTSPLPSLSLNTHLPHFTYAELEHVTNNFDMTPFKSENEMGRFLGKGAFGTVFVAFGLIEKPVAVKKLNLDTSVLANIDKVTEQFRNEVEILSKYKHENLLALLGYSCDGCTYCLIYEYVPGGSLKDRLQEKENILGWRQRCNIAIDTAKAIVYLHTAFKDPLIHRDVKTENIILDLNDKPKLGDFGLIRNLCNKTTTFTTPFGTSAYMPREAFSGDTSVKLDTYSFGVVLLELLTSLSAMDEKREERDLVSHVYDKCEDNIDPLLDKEAGNWISNDVNVGEELFKIALKCLEEKKNRETMVETTKQIENLAKRAELINY